MDKSDDLPNADLAPKPNEDMAVVLEAVVLLLLLDVNNEEPKPDSVIHEVKLEVDSAGRDKYFHFSPNLSFFSSSLFVFADGQSLSNSPEVLVEKEEELDDEDDEEENTDEVVAGSEAGFEAN